MCNFDIIGGREFEYETTRHNHESATASFHLTNISN